MSGASLKTLVFLAAIAVQLTGTAWASDPEAIPWWHPGPRASEASTVRHAGEAVIVPAEAVPSIAGELPESSLRLLRLLSDDPRRVRACLVALREFGLLRERRTPTSDARVRVAQAPALISEQKQ